jgi:flotillin
MEFFIAAFGALAIVGVAGVAAALGLAGNLLYICEPNEVLIFSGRGSKGYQVVKGGRRFRVPLLERVDRLDLTNMIIDVHVENAYSAGGIPLIVQGVANLKIGSHEHVLEHAVERLLGKDREEIRKVAKDILEGTLRGVLAQLTPEQVNEDKMAFAEQLLKESEADLTRLGLVLDTMKIQNVADERGYLNAIGRRQSAEIIKKSRIAEAKARATATVRDATNRQRARLREVEAQEEIERARAERRITDARGRREAMVAEAIGQVEAAIARAESAIKAEEARIEMVRKRLEADVVEPARAGSTAEIDAAKGRAAKILEDGRATVQVLDQMIGVWKAAGPNARDVFLLQKLESVLGALVDTIGAVRVDRLTMLPPVEGGASGASGLTRDAVRVVEELKATLGVDLPQLLTDAARGRGA